MSDPRREPFDWLADPQARHGGLEMIRTAGRPGWLEGSAREPVARRRRPNRTRAAKSGPTARPGPNRASSGRAFSTVSSSGLPVADTAGVSASTDGP